MSRTARTAALAISLLALVPAAASAATVEARDGRVVVTAVPGEANNLGVGGGSALVPEYFVGGDLPLGDVFDDLVRFRDVVLRDLPRGFETVYGVTVEERGSAPLTAGAGCTQVEPTRVSCALTGGWFVTADLGDGDDRLEREVVMLGGGVADLDAFLGDGNDSFGADPDGFFAGGPVTDYVEGGNGADAIRTGVLADTIRGGDGPDVLFGGIDGDNIHGGYGDDTIDGGLDGDYLNGDSGHDMIGQLVVVRRCTTSSSFTRICVPAYAFAEEPVEDGRDTTLGGPGDDRLSTFDRATDNSIYCGTGTDTLERDAADSYTSACDTITNRS